MKDKEFGYAMKALRMVIRREWHRMTSRRLYLGVCVVLPLFCLFFMATIFGNGQMENIPVGIVDLDNTATSRNISRRISAGLCISHNDNRYCNMPQRHIFLHYILLYQDTHIKLS